MEKITTLAPEICKVYFKEKSLVTSITAGSDSNHKVVTLPNGQSWEEIYATPATKEYSEDQKTSSSGPYYEHKVEFFYPGKDAAARSDFNNYGNKQILIKLAFHNGDDLLLGSLEVPVMPSFLFSVKKGGYVITFALQSIQPAFYID
jgi:hypothetical protein